MQNIFETRAGFIDRGQAVFLSEKMGGGGKNFFSAKVGGRSLFHLEKSGTTTFSKGKKGAIQDSVNYVTSSHSLTTKVKKNDE